MRSRCVPINQRVSKIVPRVDFWGVHLADQWADRWAEHRFVTLVGPQAHWVSALDALTDFTVSLHDVCSCQYAVHVAIFATNERFPVVIQPVYLHARCSLICGGTGLSPMFQIIRELYFNRRFDIDVSMIYACPRPDVFPFYTALHQKAAIHPNFKLTCAVDSTAGLPWTEVCGAP